MKIGFALISSNPVFDQVISIENKIHVRAGFLDYLGTHHNLPHTTIFQGNLSDETNYCAIAEKIAKKFTELFPSKTIDFGDVIYVPEGWYFWMCKKTKEFQELHDLTLKLVELNIVLEPSRFNRNIENIPSIQLEAIRRYGYRYAGEAFFPHITVGRTTNEDTVLLSELNSEFASIEKRAEISRITVYRMGNNGTHSETLYEIRL
ncbi:MAG: hypothetical protein IJZ51_11380 [Ruminiclostridium sp.]|nr:hypothetical protein [Ruminiclostridium sp.]